MSKKDLTPKKRSFVELIINNPTTEIVKPTEYTESIKDVITTEIVKPTEYTESIKDVITTEIVKPTEDIKTQNPKKSSSQTFYIFDIENDIIENFVIYKRMNGDVRFSKKSAISEALELLKESEKKGIRFDIPKFENSVRQNRSYTVSSSDWEFINEVYVNKRTHGDTNFTFSNVISAALVLLQTKYPNLQK